MIVQGRRAPSASCQVIGGKSDTTPRPFLAIASLLLIVAAPAEHVLACGKSPQHDPLRTLRMPEERSGSVDRSAGSDYLAAASPLSVLGKWPPSSVGVSGRFSQTLRCSHGYTSESTATCCVALDRWGTFCDTFDSDGPWIEAETGYSLATSAYTWKSSIYDGMENPASGSHIVHTLGAGLPQVEHTSYFV